MVRHDEASVCEKREALSHGATDEPGQFLVASNAKLQPAGTTGTG